MVKDAEKQSHNLAYIKEIAEGVSTQSRFSNRLWVALMIFAFVVLLHTAQPPEQNKINLPFQLGSVDTTVFYVVSCPMLAVLLIAFLAAHAQQVRAADLAQRMIDKLENNKNYLPHPRDIYDFMRYPTLIRVAPLPQLARGKYQFYPKNADCPLLLKILTTFYYVFLKTLGVIVYFILPCVALIFAFFRFIHEPTEALNWSKWIVGAFVLAALIASIQIIFIEFRYILHIVKVIGLNTQNESSDE